MEKLTDAQRLILRTAVHYPPSRWVVDAGGYGRKGWERVSWKRNCEKLAAAGYLQPSGFGDWYLTALGETFREASRAGR